MENGAIGIFDSGVGGLSILAQVRQLVPGERILYFADQANVPYGPRGISQVRAFSESITTYLLNKGAKIVVVACNTASAAALQYLREVFPDIPFVGMEPAVKPAAQSSRSQKVGVLATPTTFQGELFGSVVERFAKGIEVIQQTLPGLVERIEMNDLDSSETRAILVERITPLIEAGVDTLVLACTHYAFLIPTIEDMFGSSVVVIDPSPAIARQARYLINQGKLELDTSDPGEITYISTRDANQLVHVAEQLIQLHGVPLTVSWDGSIVQE
jgi:glutamate racemase